MTVPENQFLIKSKIQKMKKLGVNLVIAVPRDTAQRFIHIEYAPFNGVNAASDVMLSAQGAKVFNFLNGDFIGDEGRGFFSKFA